MVEPAQSGLARCVAVNELPARVAMAYAEDGRFIGFVIERVGTCIAVDLMGGEHGPFRTEDAAIAALARGRRFELSRRPESLTRSAPPSL